MSRRPPCVGNINDRYHGTLSQDTLWSADSREEMTHLNNRVAGFLNGALRREEGHVFVVSHGVFMETAIRQITSAYPQ